MPTHLGASKGKEIFELALRSWPWSRAWWKPVDFRRDLVKAAALIVAEGDKHDGARRPAIGASVQPSCDMPGCGTPLAGCPKCHPEHS